jgi:endonuclease YncB( thermonuclease family)
MMKKKLMSILGVFLFLSIAVCQADIYFWTDEQGKKHFSDTWQADAKTYQKSKHTSFYSVKSVFDGDTIQLKDGRKIRLVGINTPEIAHRNSRAQQGGVAAKKWLTKLLLGKKVRLEFAIQKRDKYKRYLAHIFTANGLHINLELVRLGFASVNIFPPNIAYVKNLVHAEDKAEKQKLGIWQYASYAIKPVQKLNLNNKYGWQRVVGKIIKIQQSKKHIDLLMSHTFKLRIKKQYLHFFSDINDLKGKTIEARGWVNKSKNKMLMQVKHPSVLKVVGSREQL